MKTSKLLIGLGLFALALTGCGSTGDDTPSHQHTFSNDWTHDETYHWHAATCGHTSETKDKAEHTFGEWHTGDNDSRYRICSVCQYQQTESYKKGQLFSTHSLELTVGQSHKIPVATQHELTYTISDSSVVSINGDQITAQSVGKSVITGKDSISMIYDTLEVNVTEKETPPDTHPDGEHVYDPNRYARNETTHWNICLYCDERVNEEPHSFSFARWVVQPTFERGGSHIESCKCGYEITVTDTALEHNFSTEWSYDEENHYHECIDYIDDGHGPSQQKYDLKADVAPHQYGDWVIDEPETETEFGVKHRECSICGYKQTDMIYDIHMANSEKYLYFELVTINGADAYRVYISNDAVVARIPATHNDIPVLVLILGNYGLNDEMLDYQAENLVYISIPESIANVFVGVGLDKLKYNVYEGFKYLGNETNGYLVLVDYIDWTKIGSTIKIHKQCKILKDTLPYNCESFYIDDDATYYTVVDGMLLTKDKETLIRYPAERLSSTIETPSTVKTIERNAIQVQSISTNLDRHLLDAHLKVYLNEGLEVIKDEAFGYFDFLTWELYLPSTIKEFELDETLISRLLSTLTNLSTYNNGLYLGTTDNQYMFLIGFETRPNNVAFSTHADCEVAIIDRFTNITSLTFTDKVRVVSSSYSYGEIREMYLGKSVESLSYSLMKSVTMNFQVSSENQTYSASSGGLLMSKDGKQVISAGKNKVGIYVPEGVEEICDYALYDLNELETLQLPSTLKRLGERALYGTIALKSLVLPSSLEYIGRAAIGGFAYWGDNFSPVSFDGTIEQFNLIEKDELWHDGSFTFVTCTNDVVTL